MINMVDELHCPFDGDFCELKKKRFDEWRERCLHNPQPYYTSMNSAEILGECPIRHIPERKDSCDRFRRYLYIVDKVMTELKQNEQQR